MNQRCDQEKWLTPFLLGDLTERDEADFSRHLAGCDSCQDCARELSPVLQSLSNGLARDDATAPRFDLHHQLTLLTVPAENPHRVIEWMSRARPWLVAAACALVVTGLSYFVLFSSMSRQYGFNGYHSLRMSKTVSQPLAIRASLDPDGDGILDSREYLVADGPTKNGRPESAASGFAYGFVTRAQEEITKSVPSKEDTDGDFDGLPIDSYYTRSSLNTPPPDGSAVSAPDLVGVDPVAALVGNGGTIERDLGDRFSKLADKEKIGQSSASRVKHDGNGLYASRTAEGRELALRRYGGAGEDNGKPAAESSAYVASAGKPARNKHAGGSVVYGLTSPYPQPEKLTGPGLKGAVPGERLGLAGRGGTILDVMEKAEENPDDGRFSIVSDYYSSRTERESKKATPAAQDKPQNGERGEAKNWTVEGWIKPGDKSAAKTGRGTSSTTKTSPIVNGYVVGGGVVITNAVAFNAKDLPQNEPAAPRAPRAKATVFNPFVATTENRFSTFAIDVNTASYNLTRQSLRSGALPEPDVVRTEEILNAFDYGDTAPDRATFRVYVEGAPSPFGEAGLSLLRIGVKGKRLGREEQRPAMLTFLVDSSGSMAQPNRLGRARTALRLLVDQLAAADKIQIISFDDKARLVLPPTSARQKQAILQAFDRIQCNGSTNLEDGMHRAYQQAAKAFAPGGENRVILISDGVANLGADNAQDILREIEAFRKQGVTCSVFGVGEGSYNDALLEELANKGQGVYRFLDSDEEVKRVFVDDLAATLNNIATDVKIQVEWSSEAVRRFRQLGYERRALKAEQFRDDTVDAGEVGSGQSVSALYELDLAPGGKHAALGTVRVRYRRADTGAIEEISQAITPEMIAPSLRAARPQFRLAASAAAFAEMLRGSPYVTREYTDVAHLLLPVTQELALDTRVKELQKLVETAATLTK